MTCIARKRLKDRRQVLITSHSTRFVKHLIVLAINGLAKYLSHKFNKSLY